jgi:hypothetical protein
MASAAATIDAARAAPLTFVLVVRTLVMVQFLSWAGNKGFQQQKVSRNFQ